MHPGRNITPMANCLLISRMESHVVRRAIDTIQPAAGARKDERRTRRRKPSGHGVEYASTSDDSRVKSSIHLSTMWDNWLSRVESFENAPTFALRRAPIEFRSNIACVTIQA